MANDLGDARSREDNSRFRDMVERRKGSEPEYAYAPRWVPTGNWRMSGFDLFIILLGVGIILMTVAMRLLGTFEVG